MLKPLTKCLTNSTWTGTLFPRGGAQAVCHSVPTATPVVISPVQHLLHLHDWDEASCTGLSASLKPWWGKGSPRGTDPCYCANEAPTSKALPRQWEESAVTHPSVRGQTPPSPEALSGHCTDVFF